MKTNLLVFLTLVISGCATAPSLLNSKPVPEDRLLLGSKLNEKPSAEIGIFRDSSISGSACYYAVYVDEALAARIGSSERVVFKLDPGERRLKITRDPQGKGLCSSGDDMAEEKITLVASDKKYFRLSMTISGWPKLHSMQVPAERF